MDDRDLIVHLCRTLLLGLFAGGRVWTPAQLEDSLVGGGDVVSLTMGSSRWFSTPFCDALKELVAEGKIAALHGPDGWIYKEVPNV